MSEFLFVCGLGCNYNYRCICISILWRVLLNSHVSLLSWELLYMWISFFFFREILCNFLHLLIFFGGIILISATYNFQIKHYYLLSKHFLWVMKLHEIWCDILELLLNCFETEIKTTSWIMILVLHWTASSNNLHGKKDYGISIITIKSFFLSHQSHLMLYIC